MLKIRYRIGDQVINVKPDILDDSNRHIKVNTNGRVIGVSDKEGIQMLDCVWYIDQYPYYTTFELPATYVIQKR